LPALQRLAETAAWPLPYTRAEKKANVIDASLGLRESRGEYLVEYGTVGVDRIL
jgi:hypothetical protein